MLLRLLQFWLLIRLCVFFLSCPDERSFINSSYLPDLSDQDVMKLAVAAFSLSILTSLGAFISYKRFSRKRKGS